VTPGLAQGTTGEIPTQANSSFKKNASSGVILKSDDHPQKNVLTDADKKLIAAYVGEEAEMLGYQTDRVSGLDKIYAQLKYLFSK
jgi:hypothetical protein